MNDIGSAVAAAQEEARSLIEEATYDLTHNEYLAGNYKTSYFLIESGPHVDSDLGIDYVPVNEPVNPYRRRKVVACQVKKNALHDEAIAELEAGTDPGKVARDLAKRQRYPAVNLALNETELVAVLTVLFHLDALYPGHLEGGYFTTVRSAVAFGYEEGLSCEGGITDRYAAASMERGES